MSNSKPDTGIDSKEAEAGLAKWVESLALADKLMCGFTDRSPKGRLGPIEYYEDGSKDEDTARMAIAHVLRSELPLKQDFRNRLAALFDPNDHTHVAINNRKLVFRYRWAKRPDDFSERNTEIVMYIYGCRLAGDTHTKALEKAHAKYSLTENTIDEIWDRYRKRLELIEGPLPKRGKRGKTPRNPP